MGTYRATALLEKVSRKIDLPLPQARDCSRGQRYKKTRKEDERETD